ncbi:hypothetical protein SAMN05892877_10923 [Rhizobium subbaraonis]|uniref:Uncharacterized protein n=1 Tax=Rhizobium subbaraonis TaxID=908946 RepID=A0A285UI64_9HYPH|nr:hypothetical protein [Rhizobium subbaraonis]SOC41604.1 hypothetical protein SAMN05892877_10923 [Rhizobium subbaraonis]
MTSRMHAAVCLPLFDRSELDRVRAEREELLKRLQKGGRDARSRIRMEQKVNRLTAAQVRLESQLGIGRKH